jgi:hypothetical protein
LKQARDFKFNKQFSDTRTILEKLATDKQLSPGFCAAIGEQHYSNRPLYEAEISKTLCHQRPFV